MSKEYDAKLISHKARWEVEVNLTAQDWQLYTSEPELAQACDAAAQSINAGIRALALTGAHKFAAYRQLLKPFMWLGACDTEPECVLAEVLYNLGIIPENERC